MLQSILPKRDDDLKKLIFASVSLLLSFFFFLMADLFFKKEAVNKEKYETTIGKVLRINQDAAGKRFPVVSFVTLDSQKITQPLLHESAKRLKADEIVVVHYDLVNPSDVQLQDNDKSVFTAVNLMAFLFMLNSTVFFFLLRRAQLRRNFLRNKGRQLRLVPDSVGLLPRNENTKSPRWVATAVWEREDRQRFVLVSQPLKRNPEELVRAKGFISVFIHPKNPKNYLFDAE